MRPVVYAALLAILAFPCLAQEVDRDKVQSALDAFWKTRKDEVLAAPALAAKDSPATDPAGQQVCPVHRVAMLEFGLEKETTQDAPDAPVVVSRQHVAFYCPTGPEAYVRTEARAAEATWRGPFADPSFPLGRARPIEIPIGSKPDSGQGATREQVEKCLMRHITDSGEQGYFANRYQDIKDLGPGAADHLLAIFESSKDPQLKHLSVEALGEVADASAVPKLRRLAGESKNQEYSLSLAVALYRLGEPAEVDRMLERSRSRLEDETAPATKASILGGMGLIYSLIGKEDEALEQYQEATKLDAGNSIAFYNLACSYSKLGRVDDAIGALEGALQAGYEDWEWMMVDGDLEAVRADARFKELYVKYRK